MNQEEKFDNIFEAFDEERPLFLMQFIKGSPVYLDNTSFERLRLKILGKIETAAFKSFCKIENNSKWNIQENQIHENVSNTLKQKVQYLEQKISEFADKEQAWQHFYKNSEVEWSVKNKKLFEQVVELKEKLDASKVRIKDLEVRCNETKSEKYKEKSEVRQLAFQRLQNENQSLKNVCAKTLSLNDQLIIKTQDGHYESLENTSVINVETQLKNLFKTIQEKNGFLENSLLRANLSFVEFVSIVLGEGDIDKFVYKEEVEIAYSEEYKKVMKQFAKMTEYIDYSNKLLGDLYGISKGTISAQTIEIRDLEKIIVNRNASTYDYNNTAGGQNLNSQTLKEQKQEKGNESKSSFSFNSSLEDFLKAFKNK
ncbi:MAG TPA: hypothetical protein PKX92_02670 [Edaphocola sp.]|nr:hypothetical protein [Edaphocola sp.]